MNIAQFLRTPVLMGHQQTAASFTASLHYVPIFIFKKNLFWISWNLGEGAYSKYVGGGCRRVLQIFQKNFQSLGDHRPEFFMAQ